MSEETRETTRLPRPARDADGRPRPILPHPGRPERRQKSKQPRAVEPRRAKGMWVPTWLFWLWWVLVLVPTGLLVYESVVGW